MDVYVGDELVGELRVRPHDVRGNAIVITKHQAPEWGLNSFGDDELIPSPAMCYHLQLRRRRIAVGERERMYAGEDHIRDMLRRYRVPDDAEHYRVPARDETVYQWNVISIDAELLEQIFDFPEFEPTDAGPPDIDRMMRERLEGAAFGP